MLGAPPDTDAYEPTGRQETFVTTRDRTCRMPNCAQRVGWADLDHVIPHSCGGETSCTNLCCLCRTDHRLKTFAPGWTFVMEPDGTLHVTTPSGITRTTRPPGLRRPPPEPPPDRTRTPTHHPSRGPMTSTRGAGSHLQPARTAGPERGRVMPKQIPCLWFDGTALPAAEHYTAIFPNSSIDKVTHYGPDMPPPMKEGDVLTVEFTLDGQEYVGLNGGPQFPFSEAISFQIMTKDQEETDYYWDRLTEGGEESMCGWLKDKFGLSWQVSPIELMELTS